MFTGIVEEIGTLRNMEGLGDEKRLTIECAKVADGINDGDSISIDGACLTVTAHGRDFFTAHASVETLSRTTLGALKTGSKINLERAMQMGDRFGGHIVLGHVDCIGSVIKYVKTGEGREMWVELPDDYISYVAPKGSITLDGVSLTSVQIKGNRFSVSLIPFTLERTTLGTKVEGDSLNIEVDIIARYIRRFLETDKTTDGLDMRKLMEEGFA